MLNPLVGQGRSIDAAGSSSSTNRGVTVSQLKGMNSVAFILTIALNGLSSAGALSPQAVGEISDLHPTKLTPAGPAFSIWGIIYSLQASFIVYQFFWPTDDLPLLLHGIGFWYMSSCLFNSLWIITFVQGTVAAMWGSTFLIAGLLFSICKIYINTSCWLVRRPGGILQATVLDVHFSMYGGWVTVATIVNVAIALTTTGWEGEPFTSSSWSVIMLIIAFGINSYIVVSRNDCAWGFVLVWASSWIAAANEGNKVVVPAAVGVAIAMALISLGVSARVAMGWVRA